MLNPRITVEEFLILTKREFWHFNALKVPDGKDEFSKLRKEKLLTMLTEQQIKTATYFKNPPDRDSCARWMLRGLPNNLAVGKVCADKEMNLRNDFVKSLIEQGIIPTLEDFLFAKIPSLNIWPTTHLEIWNKLYESYNSAL